MVNHGLATGALLLTAGFLIARRGSARIGDYGGVHHVAPLLAGAFLLAGLAALALPGQSTFVSVLVLVGIFTRYPVAAILATLGAILAAVYIMWMYQRTMHGPIPRPVQYMRELNHREAWAVAPLLALIIAFGVYPKPLLDIVTPAVASTVSTIAVSDPTPLYPSPVNPVPRARLPDRRRISFVIETQESCNKAAGSADYLLSRIVVCSIVVRVGSGLAAWEAACSAGPSGCATRPRWR